VADFTMFKEVFVNIQLQGLRIHVDLGFLGIKNLHPDSLINIPHKSSKNSPLTAQQKKENQKLARFRVVVEHAIAKLKVFFILRIENRMKMKEKLDEAFVICAGLANLKINLHKSLVTNK
jgi:hypothetical protein